MVAVTFCATAEIIEEAGKKGAGIIITHEPTFYNHQDNTEGMDFCPVVKKKKELLEKYGISIWRIHDRLHKSRPDIILDGVVKELGWERFRDPENPSVFIFDSISANEIAEIFKKKTGGRTPLISGDRNSRYSRVLLMPGATGGQKQLAEYNSAKAEIIVCGEVSEWETPEYFRDSAFLGQGGAVVVCGHAESEKAGMKYLCEILQLFLTGVEIFYMEGSALYTSR
ncbi:MAG: Nif3-like dinuclear metal center hexameric protein [Fibrobacterota bacterium]